KAVEIATSSGTVPAAFTAGTDQSVSSVNEASGTNAVDEPVVGMDLPSLLAYVGGQHPAVGQARWRVQEAYAELDQARAMWLPTLQAGMSYHRHDGNYQASNGAIVDVNRNSLQYGLGVGAVGAGTTPRPGALVQFHLADALFAPEIAEKTAWARGHAAGAEMNRQLLNVAVAYLRLLEAQQILSVMEDVRSNTAAVAKLTSDFAETGQGLQSDADRLSTELQLVDSRRLAAQQQIEIATAELVQALSWDSPARIVPTDPSVVPFHLVALDTPRESLIATGLAQRPELKEAQALVAAAIAAYRRERSAPFVPSVLLGFSAGGFGGGLGSGVDNTDSRYDFDAAVAWQVRNLGLGEKAARRGAVARLQQARFEKVERMDSIAREISTAHAKVVFAHQRIETTRRAVETARSSYVLNVQRIRDGHGLPVEALQSIQALEAAQRAYVQAIVEHNIAQFELQYALGWPVCFAE
ncbi:MAG: TolC family protein, partial [Planctomycetota bacterium]